MAYFDEGDFEEAMPVFEKLMQQFPQDPMYRYYLGVSQVQLNHQLEGAVELLYFASRRGVPEDVYYYMAEAYRKLYDFEKAKKYYIQFDREASRSLGRDKKSKQLIRSVQNATSLTAMYNPFEVINVTFVNLYDPEQYEQVKMKGGNLVQKPDEFFAQGEDRQDLNNLMFMPRVSDRGKLIYFSGFQKNRKDGYQIMQARKGNTGKWTDIKPVEELNTDGNEILPYFDPVGKDIYFASDGREGLGGFDLYQSHYDEERGEWSTPVNLGFPVNSTMDDYLVLPGSDLGMVIIFTGRQVLDSAVAVYRVHLSEPKQSLATATPEELSRIASFDNTAKRILADYTTVDKVPEQEITASEKEIASSGPGNKPVQPEKPVGQSTGSGYQSLIAKALKHQATSDSLTELSAAARVKVRDSDDPNDRWLYQSQIMVWEKKARTERELADEFFMAADGFGGAARTETSSIPDAIVKDTVINEMTVYRFANVDSVQQKAKTVFKEKTEPEPDEANIKTVAVPTAKKTGNELIPINDFEILPSSPYNAGSPIPMDLALPKGVIYRIQVGVFSTPVTFDQFGGIAPILGETLSERNLYKYYAGTFSRYTDVQKALPKVRESGFQDAFVVAWYNGVKMSTDKVRKLEK